MSGNKGWLEKFLEPGRAERKPAPHFVAYRWTGATFRTDPVRNISSTGVYVVTEERLHPGAFVSLLLQREGPLERDPERRITTQARVARHGEDGVGLAFVMPTDKRGRQWASLFDGLVAQMNPEDLKSFVRIHGAVEFLHRICPDSAEELGQLLHGRLSNHKLANALEIALWAEGLLSSDPASGTLLADPHLVGQILEVGSSTEELWLQHSWGGLLAACSSVNGTDNSSRTFVELFSQMVTFQARILTVVCTRATKVPSDSGKVISKPLPCDLEEIVATTGSRGVNIDRDLQQLSELGLIEKSSADSPTLLRRNEIYITPSSLGLELHARCNGHRGSPQEFYTGSMPVRG